MKKGDIVKGRITTIKPYGAFVKINESIDGLIHISEISDRFVKSIEDFVSVGDILDFEVISISKDNKLSLSYKSISRNRRKKKEKIDLIYGFDPFELALKKWIEDYFNK